MQSISPLYPIRIRCCSNRKPTPKPHNHYDLLGVAIDADSHHIRQAYRKLQKKFHPDVAGPKSHDFTLMLNEAYKVLMTEHLRRDYDASIGRNSYALGRYSSWNGPLRPQALFVDANACIGCRECVHHASNTFEMDEALGCARVKVQYGDDDQKIEVSVDSCPVNCIHWVEREELAVLEFLVQPQPVEGYGVFGGGWERPANIFRAAKAFNKQQKWKTATDAYSTRNVEPNPAQAASPANFRMKSKIDMFSKFWNFFKIFG